MVNIRDLDPSASPLDYYGSELRRLREDAGLKQGELGVSVFCTASLIGQIETARKVPTRDFSERVDAALGTGGVFSRLVGLVLRSQLPSWFQAYAEMEARAAYISTYQAQLVYGLLQTKDYARAVFAGEQSASTDTSERQVKLRMQRQETLFGRRPEPRLVTVLGEGALTRQVGGEAVLEAQTEHLRRVARRDNVEIKVLPWSVGAHAAMAGAFRILDFDDPDDPDVVYLESHVGALYLEEPAEVNEYRRIFELIRAGAIPVEDYR